MTAHFDESADLPDLLWEAIAKVRDARPRVPNDADTWEIVDAAMEIVTARTAPRFMCQTHMCGECGGCKAAKVRDLLSEARATEAVLRGEIRRTESALATFDDVVEERDEALARLRDVEEKLSVFERAANAAPHHVYAGPWLAMVDDVRRVLNRPEKTTEADR